MTEVAKLKFCGTCDYFRPDTDPESVDYCLDILNIMKKACSESPRLQRGLECLLDDAKRKRIGLFPGKQFCVYPATSGWSLNICHRTEPPKLSSMLTLTRRKSL